MIVLEPTNVITEQQKQQHENRCLVFGNEPRPLALHSDAVPLSNLNH